MTVRINKQKINLREKLTEFEDKVNFDEVVRGLGEYGGNVGIGTTSPVDKLHIQGDSSTVYDDTASAGQRTNSNLLIENKNTAAHTFASLDFLTNNSRVLNRIIGGHYDLTNKGFLAFVTEDNGQTSEKMRIDSAGNVGIGTTNPAQKLDVYGNIAVNGVTVHTSDDRVKHNEQTIVGALETLSKITPKKYIKTVEMYDANHDFELDADGNPIDSNGEPVEHRIEAGVIAQQVLKVDELAFAVSPEGVDEDGTVTSPHGLDYNSLFTYAIAAIQEQQQTIEDLKSRIETLESK